MIVALMFPSPKKNYFGASYSFIGSIQSFVKQIIRKLRQQLFTKDIDFIKFVMTSEISMYISSLK